MDESQDLIYEESEVLWAKIRGYPWWPAYVSDVHEASIPSAYEYTVIFFGDNTKKSAPDQDQHYSECYLKAKTNKKLKESIEKAQQRLSENHQDVSMYENIRNELAQKRKKGTVSESRRSSSEKADLIQLPDLVKHRTEQPQRGRKPKPVKKDTEIFEQQSQSSRQCSNHQPPKQTGRSSLLRNVEQKRKRISKQAPSTKKVQSPVKPNQPIIVQQQTPEQRKKRSVRSKEIIDLSPVDKDRHESRSNQKCREKLPKEVVVQPKQQSQSAEEQSQGKQEAVKPTLGKRKGRKGRPPKSEQLKTEKHKFLRQLSCENQNSEEQVEEAQQTKRNRKKPRNLINPFSVSKSIEQQQKIPSEAGTLTEKQADRIRKSLNNRKQLTKVLLDMPINTNNIKQILDLGTSLALQDGPITKNIHLLLCTLKAALLHKYFPDNNKHRKKYEKMTKQKKKAVEHSDEDEDDNDNQNDDIEQNNSDDDNKNAMCEEKMEEKQKPVKADKNKRSGGNKQNKAINKIEGPEDQKLRQIRIKASSKLEKMIRRAGLNEHARDYAAKIEKTFQSTAEFKGDLYRNIAYQRMRNLKTKLSQFGQNKANPNEVKTFLEEAIQIYESETSAVHTFDVSYPK